MLRPVGKRSLGEASADLRVGSDQLDIPAPRVPTRPARDRPPTTRGTDYPWNARATR
jgi:hypothetical protein